MTELRLFCACGAAPLLPPPLLQRSCSCSCSKAAELLLLVMIEFRSCSCRHRNRRRCRCCCCLRSGLPKPLGSVGTSRSCFAHSTEFNHCIRVAALPPPPTPVKLWRSPQQPLEHQSFDGKSSRSSCTVRREKRALHQAMLALNLKAPHPPPPPPIGGLQRR